MILYEIYNDHVYDFTTDNHHFSAGIGKIVVHNTDVLIQNEGNINKLFEVNVNQILKI